MTDVYSNWNYSDIDIIANFSSYNNAEMLADFDSIIINSSNSKKNRISGILSNISYTFRNSESYIITVTGSAITRNSMPFIYSGFLVRPSEREYLYYSETNNTYSYVFTPKKNSTEQIGILFSRTKDIQSARIFSFSIHPIASEKYVKIDEDDIITSNKQFTGQVDCSELYLGGINIIDLIANGSGGTGGIGVTGMTGMTDLSLWSNYPAISSVELNSQDINIGGITISGNLNNISSNTNAGLTGFSYISCDTLNYSHLNPDIIIPGSDFIPSSNNFYVSVSGDDANDGSFYYPWRTIQKGITSIEAIYSGNTGISSYTELFILAGNYNEIITITKPMIKITASEGAVILIGQIIIKINYAKTALFESVIISGMSLIGYFNASDNNMSKYNCSIILLNCNFKISSIPLDQTTYRLMNIVSLSHIKLVIKNSTFIGGFMDIMLLSGVTATISNCEFTAFQIADGFSFMRIQYICYINANDNNYTITASITTQFVKYIIYEGASALNNYCRFSNCQFIAIEANFTQPTLKPNTYALWGVGGPNDHVPIIFQNCTFDIVNAISNKYLINCSQGVDIYISGCYCSPNTRTAITVPNGTRYSYTPL